MLFFLCGCTTEDAVSSPAIDIYTIIDNIRTRYTKLLLPLRYPLCYMHIFFWGGGRQKGMNYHIVATQYQLNVEYSSLKLWMLPIFLPSS